MFRSAANREEYMATVGRWAAAADVWDMCMSVCLNVCVGEVMCSGVI